MRTVSANYPKGQEPRRRLRDDLKLIHYIFKVGLHYFIAGRRIRQEFYARQRTQQKLYIDEETPLS